jgi:N-acetylglucosamine kinase-like BadF-type ATPase
MVLSGEGEHAAMNQQSPLALGLDAGGTQTRWAVVDAAGDVLASGAVGGISALQMSDEAGRAVVAHELAELAQQLSARGRVQSLCAGVTGAGAPDEPASIALQSALAQVFQLESTAVRICSDIKLAYRDVFTPGQGYLVYAGTGSIAAFIDESGGLQRAGGRGGVLDDAGGGFWIAREALRHIWRSEDERPGAWHESVMAQRVFEHIGGSDWAKSRQFVYAGTRGAMGQLALAVASAAESDPAALAILRQAGLELARLGQALVSRYGPRPIALGGRAALLHPVIAQSMRAALPGDQSFQLVTIQPQVAAARWANFHATAAKRTES